MSTDTVSLGAVARSLSQARRTGGTVPVPPSEPPGEGDAYRIQDTVAREHGPVEGWKVGAKSPGAEPRCAPLLAGTIVSAGSGAVVPVDKPVGVEVELAFRIGPRLPAGGPLPRPHEILAMVDSVHIAVELCASRWTEGFGVPPLWSLADNLANEALLLGPRIEGWREIDFATLQARLFVDGACAVDTTGGHQAGDPLPLLVWLVRHCVGERGGLPAGAVVTTGTWTGMPVISPSTSIGAEFVGLGRMDFRLGTSAAGS